MVVKYLFVCLCHRFFFLKAKYPNQFSPKSKRECVRWDYLRWFAIFISSPILEY